MGTFPAGIRTHQWKACQDETWLAGSPFFVNPLACWTPRMAKGVAVIDDDMAPSDPPPFPALAPQSISPDRPTATEARLLDTIRELQDQGLAVQAQVTSLADEV